MIYNDIDTFLNDNLTDISKDGKYYNVAMSFDIETTSFYQDNQKKSLMYVWQFAINDNVIIKRKWEDFILLLSKIQEKLNLNEKNIVVVYVHNLSYEFQFIRKWFKIINLFADSKRKPIYFLSQFYIEFRCSYRLSGYSLDTLSRNISKPIKKLVGDLDYRLVRHSETELTDDEIQYCINDVLIVTCFINDCIERFGGISNIPLTQTGIVRRYVRNKVLQNKNIKYLIQNSKLDVSEYVLLKSAFMGGFTHCNAIYNNQKCENVTSYDFTSSYPTVLISEKYPIGSGIKTDIKDESHLIKYIKNDYCVVMEVEFFNIESTFIYEHIISKSRCLELKNSVVDNGRIVKAEYFKICITEIDYLSFRQFYKWSKMNIKISFCYRKEYLPKEIIESILKFYNDKTMLKNVEGKEYEYLHSKEMLNSIFGMCVTDINRNIFEIENNEWKETEKSINANISDYNNDKNRFLIYSWGVYCTAYARRNLFSGILECGKDYIYADTDSVKIFNAEKHIEYFNFYNKKITEKLEKALEYHSLDKNLIKPKTIRGIEKPLGVWDFDGIYKYFKTLGAKRYILTDENGDLKITIAGLNKLQGMNYINSQKDPYIFFNDNMIIPKEFSGRLTHTYIDDEIKGIVKDYKGVYNEYYEKSFVHLEESDYNMTIGLEYLDYLRGIRNKDYRG